MRTGAAKINNERHFNRSGAYGRRPFHAIVNIARSLLVPPRTFSIRFDSIRFDSDSIRFLQGALLPVRDPYTTSHILIEYVDLFTVYDYDS